MGGGTTGTTSTCGSKPIARKLTSFDFSAWEVGKQIKRRQHGRVVVNQISVCPVCRRVGLRLPTPDYIRWVHTMTLETRDGIRELTALLACTRSTHCTCKRPLPPEGSRRLVRPCPVHGKDQLSRPGEGISG